MSMETVLPVQTTDTPVNSTSISPVTKRESSTRVSVKGQSASATAGTHKQRVSRGSRNSRHGETNESKSGRVNRSSNTKLPPKKDRNTPEKGESRNPPPTTRRSGSVTERITPEKRESKIPLPTRRSVTKRLGFAQVDTPERRATINEAEGRRFFSSVGEPSTSFAYARRASAPPILPTRPPLSAPISPGQPVPITYRGLPYMLVPATALKPQMPIQFPSPLYYYPPPLRPMPPDAASPTRDVCRYFLQGTCKYGERCIFAHMPPQMPYVAPMSPLVMPSPSEAYSGVRLLREDCLVALRLLVHIEEIQHIDPSAVVVEYEEDSTEIQEDYEVPVIQITALSVSELNLQLNPNNPSPPLLIALNELLRNEVILSLSECASQITSALPPATLDAETILNKTKVCDNDALLFFSILIMDIQEHFYNSEFMDKYLRKGSDSYTYNTQNISTILEQIGMSESEVMQKFDLEKPKKVTQCFKRWRFLFLQNNPEAVVIEAEDSDATKLEILRKLENRVAKRHNEKNSEKKKSDKKLPPFSVIYGTETPASNVRRKWWNEFRANRSQEEICADLNSNVAELKTHGFTNLPAIFNSLSSKLKIVPSSEKEGPKNLDEKLAAITNLLQTWPEILLFPEILQRQDGKLHIYKSVTQEHQLGSVYEEMMTRLKKKFLYKSSLGELK